MILFEGKLLPDEELDNVISGLWDACVRAIENREDIAEKVIHACGRIAEKVKAGEYDAILQSLLQKGTFTMRQMDEAVSFFEEENIRLKYEIELGRIKASAADGNIRIGCSVSYCCRKCGRLTFLFCIRGDACRKY